MAKKQANMKGFYKKKKVTGGVAKVSSKNKSIAKTAPKNESNAKTASEEKSKSCSGDVTQYPALITHDDYDMDENTLRKFDMNMAFGPCFGMTRIARWQRAQRLGLNPPKEIQHLLENEKVQAECFLDGKL